MYDQASASEFRSNLSPFNKVMMSRYRGLGHKYPLFDGDTLPSMTSKCPLQPKAVVSVKFCDRHRENKYIEEAVCLSPLRFPERLAELEQAENALISLEDDRPHAEKVAELERELFKAKEELEKVRAQSKLKQKRAGEEIARLKKDKKELTDYNQVMLKELELMKQKQQTELEDRENSHTSRENMRVGFIQQSRHIHHPQFETKSKQGSKEEERESQQETDHAQHSQRLQRCSSAERGTQTEIKLGECEQEVDHSQQLQHKYRLQQSQHLQPETLTKQRRLGLWSLTESESFKCEGDGMEDLEHSISELDMLLNFDYKDSEVFVASRDQEEVNLQDRDNISELNMALNIEEESDEYFASNNEQKIVERLGEVDLPLHLHHLQQSRLVHPEVSSKKTRLRVWSLTESGRFKREDDGMEDIKHSIGELDKLRNVDYEDPEEFVTSKSQEEVNEALSKQTRLRVWSLTESGSFKREADGMEDLKHSISELDMLLNNDDNEHSEVFVTNQSQKGESLQDTWKAVAESHLNHGSLHASAFCHNSMSPQNDISTPNPNSQSDTIPKSQNSPNDGNRCSLTSLSHHQMTSSNNIPSQSPAIQRVSISAAVIYELVRGFLKNP